MRRWSAPQPWFKACIFVELLVQAPLWAIAAYGYAFNRQWVRLPGLIFSLCSFMLMIPIMAELIFSRKSFDRAAVLQMYAPFAISPMLIAVKTSLLRCSLITARAEVKAAMMMLMVQDSINMVLASKHDTRSKTS